MNLNTPNNQTILDNNSDISSIEIPSAPNPTPLIITRPPLPEIPITPNPLYQIPDPESVIPS